jgi:hypothetical protein
VRTAEVVGDTQTTRPRLTWRIVRSGVATW